MHYKQNGTILWKETCKSWYLYYYNGTTIIEKTISTNKSTNIKNTYNKSILSKEEAYEKILNFKYELEKTISLSSVIDIKVIDYLNLSKTNKKKMFMISNTSTIQWEKKSVPLDPYILGAWLGDGDHNGSGFTSMDDEIVKKFALWADTINCEIIHHSNSPGRNDCYHYGIRRKQRGNLIAIGDKYNSSINCNACKNSKIKHPACDWSFDKCELINDDYSLTINGAKRYDLNPFKEILKKNNLFKNKHIPREYMINDKETRMQLLAGFIDTDGCIKQNNLYPSVEISQSNRLHGNLIDQLDFIAKSLGFSTSITYSNKNGITSKGLNKTMKVLKIFGDNIYEIPTLLPRKKINNIFIS